MDREIVNNLKVLGLDMIDKANSGHPGIVLGAAPILYTVYAKHMHVKVEDPTWLNRDRFVMSAGHGSALLYATLYMAGLLTLDDLKKFRTIESITPGHPEYGVTKGVDMSTGPLGQGVASSVGMALAGKIYGSKYIIPKKSKLGYDKPFIDYYVYCLAGDGDLMEGISYEALSLAGALKLNNLIILYDSNNISLDGKTENVFENTIGVYEAMGFNTITVKDGNSISSIDKAIVEAKKSDKPTIIKINTIIGMDSMFEGTNKVHGSPLDKDDLQRIKNKLGFDDEAFIVKEELVNNFQSQIKERSNKKYEEYIRTKEQFPFPKEEPIILEEKEYSGAMRDINHELLNKIAKKIPNFIGGSADLASSTKAFLDDDYLSKTDYSHKNIHFGVREHAMGAILNGLCLCGFRPFGSTFLTFSDYCKPSLRMSALMNLPVTYIFTHDSISIGPDGPTHQPIEQLASLRAIPNFYVFRPCDSYELQACWEYSINHNLANAIVLSRGKTECFNMHKPDIIKGAYVIRKEVSRLAGTIIATGSEVGLSVKIANELYTKEGIDIRVVSMPCRELYAPNEEIIPKGYKTIVIEAGSKLGWEGFVYNPKYLITLDQFGKSGTEQQVLEAMDFSAKQIYEKVRNLLK